MDKVMEIIESIWAIDLVRFIVYLLVAFIAAGVAKLIVTKLLKLIKLDKKFDKWGINEGQVGTSMSFVGKLVYLIVFLLFLPSALEALGIEGASAPITNFVSAFIDYLPNIIAAVIVMYVGIFVAQILGHIVAVLLKKTKIDALIEKDDEDGKQVVLLSDVLVKILMSVIVLITLVAALTVLDIRAISDPAQAIVASIFGAVPSIILSVAIIACGLLVVSIACNLLANILLSINLDGVVKGALPQIKFSATKVIVMIVRVLLILFVISQGIAVLELEVLTNITAAVIGYLPLVIKALLIALVAFIGATALETFLSKTSPKAAKLGKLAKVGIYTLAVFMILSQLQIAVAIVNTAFVIILAAVAVTFVLAFGLGGRDFAKKTLDRVDDKIEKCQSENKDNENK